MNPLKELVRERPVYKFLAYGLTLCGFFLVLIMAFSMAYGCAGNQSATQQLMRQTDDPGTIALGTFADAQDAYIEIQQLYLPYQNALRQSNPDLDAEIIGYFRKANAILDDWEMFGDVPVGDKDSFRAYLREVSLRLALGAKKGGE
jgi:hypothetical protein